MLLARQVVTDVELLGAVGRERVGTGQVNELQSVAFVVDVPDLGLDGDAAVVAHVLVGTAGLVEERGLAAVGIPHKGDAQCGELLGLLATAVHALQAVQLGGGEELLLGLTDGACAEAL